MSEAVTSGHLQAGKLDTIMRVVGEQLTIIRSHSHSDASNEPNINKGKHQNDYSKLWIVGANPDKPPVLSCAGVRLGEPLGPLLSALALQPALKHLATHQVDAPCAACADDIVLQGEPEVGRRAFSALKERCAHVGLQVTDAECHAYSRSHGAAQSVSATTGPTHALRGHVVAGTPLWKDRCFVETDNSKRVR